MRLRTQTLAAIFLVASLQTLGCHGQLPPAGGSELSPELARRVEIAIRQRARLTPEDTMTVGPRQTADVPGFDRLDVQISLAADPGRLHPVTFLISKDGNTLAQFNKFDISRDPRTLVSSEGRPARGGPASAPVQIVVFDDLECPFCARMHAQLFPALFDRYKDQVRIVYRDYPIEKHPWAMRAAIDVNCLAAQNANSYWAMIDQIHTHPDDLGGPEHSIQKAKDQLDQLALDQAAKDKLDLTAVKACVTKQDETAVRASLKLGESLSVDATPALFINGEELDGAYPLEDVFRIIDQALVASGKVPPAPYKPAVAAGSK